MKTNPQDSTGFLTTTTTNSRGLCCLFVVVVLVSGFSLALFVIRVLFGCFVSMAQNWWRLRLMRMLLIAAAASFW